MPVKERGRLGLFAHLGWMSVLCQGDIRSHQDVLTVPTEITELNLTAAQEGCAGGGEKGMREGICGALEAAAGSKHRQVIGKFFRGMKLLVMFLFPEWVLLTPVLKIHETKSKTLQLLKSIAELPFHLAAMRVGPC